MHSFNRSATEITAVCVIMFCNVQLCWGRSVLRMSLYRYQFEPNRVNKTTALQILLKALVNMPKPDFNLLKSVLPATIVSNTSLIRILPPI